MNACRRHRLWALLCLTAHVASAESQQDAASRIPPIRLDEGLIVSECGQQPAGPDVPTFRKDVKCVEMLLRLVHVSGRHTLRYLYYDPEGQLYASTSPEWAITPEKPDGYHKNGWVRHRIPISGEAASLHLGEWKVAVWLDDLTVSEKMFRLTAGPQPDVPALDRARAAYLELRYEDALDALRELGEPQPASRALTMWWLALVQNALGREAEARATLERLLASDPSFSLGPEEVRQVGGELPARWLEELRAQKHPELYRQTTVPPELELSKADSPPELLARRRWYQKWWFYAGVAALAVPATVMLASGDSTVDDPGLPSVLLSVGGSAGTVTGLPCDGHVPIRLDVQSGKPGFEALITVATVGTDSLVRIDGLTPGLGTTDIVLQRANFPELGSTTLFSPNIQVGDFAMGKFSALCRFTVILRDARATTDFAIATPGATVPASILGALGTDPFVVRQEIRQGLDRCGI